MVNHKYTINLYSCYALNTSITNISLKIKILVFLARSINKSCKLTETEATVCPRLSVSPLSEQTKSLITTRTDNYWQITSTIIANNNWEHMCFSLKWLQQL